MKKILLCATLSLVSFLNAQTKIVEWTFDSPTPDARTNTGNKLPSFGTAIDSVKNIGGVTNTFATGYPSNPTGGDNSGLNTSNYPALGTNFKSAGIVFGVRTLGINTLSLRYFQRHSNTSANTTVLQYSFDGSNFTDVATFKVKAGDVWNERNINLSAFTELNNKANVLFRIVTAADDTTKDYKAATTGSVYSRTGTIRYDSLSVYGTVANASISAFKLQILHSSDMEAGLAAVSNAPHHIAIMDSLGRTYPNTIKVSGGDNFIPSPFSNASSDLSTRSTLYQANSVKFWGATGASTVREGLARADVLLMNIAGYQASAIGNHEFDFGTSVLFDAIRIEQNAGGLRWMGTQFPYLSSNLNFRNDANLTQIYTPEIKNSEYYKTLPAIANTLTAADRHKISPTTIITVNGEKIGIVGATTQIVPNISSVGGVTVNGGNANNMTQLASEIQPWVDSLTARGINKIIVLSHLQQYAFEKELAPKLKNVDVIVAAGSHTRFADGTDRMRAGDDKREVYPIKTFDKNGNTTLIVCTDGEWKYVGRLVVDFDSMGILIPSRLDSTINGAYAADSLGVVAVCGNYNNAFTGNKPGALAKDITSKIQNIITTQDGNIFGVTNKFIQGERNSVRVEETNLGNLSADANLWYTKKKEPTIVASIKNGGGIRASIGEIRVLGSTNALELLPPQANPAAKKAEGDISQLDISNSLRFNNGLVAVTLKPIQLLEVINHAVATWTPTATPGQFCQIGGLKFSFDPTLPAGTRVKTLVLIDSLDNIIDEVYSNGALRGDTSRGIRVTTLNFLENAGNDATALGGDSYPFPKFRRSNPTFYNRTVFLNTLPKDGNAVFADNGSEQDALAEYLLSKHPNVSKAYNTTDTEKALDKRIQNLSFRSDDILVITSENENGETVENTLRIYPVPTDGIINIEYNLKAVSKVNVSIIDSKGMSVEKFDSELLNGKTTKQYLLENNAGLYYIKIEMNGNTIVRPVILK
jgi:2',3'-cyclic-nucleotide 2'-phosphodiesterase (5'-nucleotidase family)